MGRNWDEFIDVVSDEFINGDIKAGKEIGKEVGKVKINSKIFWALSSCMFNRVIGS
ncbi:MAG: hypothetical protein Q8807_02640 ['Waltheria sp.' little leaf phytoplasma]|nr:hypothetical protein ['Waltheria sp.' little leaf phytoplasma]